MTEPSRKKSTSSDSELSDSWSVVEHTDTTPLVAPVPEMNPCLFSSSIPQLHTSSTQVQSSAEEVDPSAPHDETSSDGESVEIIQDDTKLNDFGYPISRITKICAGKTGSKEAAKDKDLTQVKDVLLTEQGTDYFSNSNLYSNEWFRLFVFISSLTAFLLLLVSYTSLFIKDPSYSKSDGMITLPDEDLSSLIADLTLFKDENSRLKEELNMIKYEYGNNKVLNVKPDDSLILMPTDEIIGLEVISDDSPVISKLFKPSPLINDEITANAKLEKSNKVANAKELSEMNRHQQDKSVKETSSMANKNDPNSGKIVNNQYPSSESQQEQLYKDSATELHKRFGNLVKLEEGLKMFIKNINLKNVIISSYNIQHNIKSIDLIIQNLNSILDNDTSGRKENKKMQLEQKVMKLNDKIEQDFKKMVEKVAKRINKFYYEFLSAFCRLKGGTSENNGIDCSPLNQNKNGNHKDYKKPHNHNKEYEKDSFKKQRSNFKDGSSFNNESFDSDEDVDYRSDSSKEFSSREKMTIDNTKDYVRYKRSSDGKHDYNTQRFKYDKYKHSKKDNANSEQKVHQNYDKSDSHKHHHHYDNDYHNKKQNYHQHRGADRSSGNKQESSNNFGQSTYTYDSKSTQKDARFKEKNNYRDSDSRGNGMYDDKNYNYHSEEIVKTEYRYFNDDKYNLYNKNDFFKYDDKIKRYSNKCLKKNCNEKTDKFKQQTLSNHDQKLFKNKRNSFGSKSPSSPIHNESIYSKVVSSNGNQKAEGTGEWYLDLGEVRNQKRFRRAMKDKDNWMFDRALVREWCRSNAGSSLCASLGQNCDYCV